VQLRQDSSYCAYPWLQHRGKCLTRHQRSTQRSKDLTEPGEQTAELQEHDQLLADDETDWMEDDLEQQQGLPDYMEGSRLSSITQARRSASHSSGKRKVQASEDNSLDFDHPTTFNRLARRLSTGFADLDSSSGRTAFIFTSILYLFTTTYKASDDLTISSLLTYLNAAIPPDKHEDFDTAEVIRGAAALQIRGNIIFEGDILRLPK